MGLAYEPSLSDGRYQVSENLNEGFSIEKTTPRILSFAVGFYPKLLLCTVHRTGRHMTQWKKMTPCPMYHMK
jgi:hypothetical protein